MLMQRLSGAYMPMEQDAAKREWQLLPSASGVNWKMHQVGSNEMIPAVVPGTVYTDMLREGKMEDPFWKDNEDKALAMMDEDYEYICTFGCEEELLAKEAVILQFQGLDTLADVTLNGVLLGSTDNMHRTWEFSVKQYLNKEENELKVYFHSPTQFIKEAYAKAPTNGTEDAMPGFVHIRKAHCMFGWDWGAHLPDAGIFRPVVLLGVDVARIDNVQVLQYHEAGKVTLDVQTEVDFLPAQMKVSGLEVAVTVTDPKGDVRSYTAEEVHGIEIDRPMLWWPNGYGEQNLYAVKVELKKNGVVLDTWENRVGLRTMTMNRTKDQWGECFCTRVNGVDIFAMGADYIPEDHLLGRVNPSTTRTLLEKAVFANFNSIRVWGGGYYPDDWFFDLCDEMGLVVWEDFMFACAVYDLTPAFEATITQEFIDNLKRIRHHASLGLMCGNNEMEKFVSVRTWVSKDAEVRDYIIMYERILPAIMKQYAPQVYYWPASPSSGGSFDDPDDPNRGDQHYWDVWHGNKPFSEYRKFFFRYASEFGFQSFPSKKTVEMFTDDPADMNIFSYIFERHQRNGAANGKIMNYMQQTYKYPSEFETVIYASQLLQADAIRYGVEHFRRNRNDNRCMGAVYWQFNDCWPVASWSSVDYAQRMKALHYAARRFFAPLMISCEEEGMINSEQQLNQLPFSFPKSITLCVSNETMREEKLVVKWQLRDALAKVLRSEECSVTVPALTSLWLDKVELPEVDIYGEYVSYQLVKATSDSKEEVVSEGTVIFSFPKYFRYVDPQLCVSVDGSRIKVKASSYAKSVEILNENEDLILSDNYFDLNADEKIVEVISGDISNLRVRSVYDIH